MKKLINKLAFTLIYLSTFILSSCAIINSEAKKIFDKYNSTNNLQVNKTLFVDDTLASNQTTYLLKEDKFKAYSVVQTKSNVLLKKDLNIEEFTLNENICLKNEDDIYYKSFSSNSIINFLGLDNIFNDAQNKNIINGKISSTIDASKCAGVVRSFLINIGAFNFSHENYYYASNVNYAIYIKNESITSIELDITDIAQLVNKNVNSTLFTYTFIENQDIKNIIDNHSFPLDDNDSSEMNIKLKGIEFIEDCFEDVEYVSDDLYFYTNTILSPKLKFTYESDKTNVIDNNGKYYEVSSDTEVNINVHLFYDSIEYDKLDFSFLAIPPSSGTGELGSQTNMLYKGRKIIDEVNIYFIEMHKEYGESIYIQAGDFDMLLDAGAPEDGGYVNDFLRRHVSDGRIELVVGSHPHSDHIGGMLTALSTFKNITYAVDYGCKRSDYSTAQNVQNTLKNADKYSPVIDCINNRNGARKTLYISEDFYVTFLNTGHYEDANTDIINYDGHGVNNTSVTLLLTYKNKQFFFGGDLEDEGQLSLLNNEDLTSIDVYTSCHHGSSNANNYRLLNKFKPNFSVISTALVDRGSASRDAQDQTHPIGSALKTLLQYSQKVYCNFTTGTFNITWNDTNSTCKGLGVTSPYYIDGKAISGEENLEFKYTKYAKRYRNRYI